MAANQTQCRLLGLPPELRNKIYELVFNEQINIASKGRMMVPGLLSTCKQIRNEGLKLFRQTATFYFVNLSDGITWYQRCPHRNDVAHIRHDCADVKMHSLPLSLDDSVDVKLFATETTQLGLPLRPGVLWASRRYRGWKIWWALGRPRVFEVE